MDIYDFITTQGRYADKHAGVGPRNLQLVKSVDEVLQEIEDLHEIMLETTVQGVPEALQAAWISVAFLAFDGARRMGATRQDIEDATDYMMQAIKEASEAADMLNNISVKGK